MQYVYKQTANINLHHVPQTAWRKWVNIINRSELKPIWCFSLRIGGRISHVGMYIGEGRFVHSPSTGKSISITSLDSGCWANKFVTARRVLDA